MLEGKGKGEELAFLCLLNDGMIHPCQTRNTQTLGCEYRDANGSGEGELGCWRMMRTVLVLLMSEHCHSPLCANPENKEERNPRETGGGGDSERDGGCIRT